MAAAPCKKRAIKKRSTGNRKAAVPAPSSARQRLQLSHSQATRLAIRRPGAIALQAKYDVSQDHSQNENHWGNTDALSSDAGLSTAIRKKMRERARYEVANNSYARGVCLTLANDLIGTGPRLQMGSREADAQIEQAWNEWAKAVRLAAKLRTMRVARAQDGEALAVLVTNERLATPVKLDLRLLECDRLHDPLATFDEVNNADGVFLDSVGEPIKYRILRNHPGDATITDINAYRDYGAGMVLHWFRRDRPEQHRGVPDILPAIPLFAELRRYMRAVVAAAEAVADQALVIQTNAPPIDEDGSGVEAMDTIELEKRMVTVLPEGYQLGQVKVEQPPQAFDMFVATLLREIGRCLNMPWNIVAGDSSAYNYASGRLDHLTYFKSISVDRDELATAHLDRIFREWLREFLADTTGISPRDLNLAGYSWQWHWDGHEHVDPAKTAVAKKTNLTAGITSLPREYAEQGRDWQTEMTAAAEAFGLSLPEYQELLRKSLFKVPAAPQAPPKKQEADNANAE